MKAEVRRATALDALELAAAIRPADADELRAACGNMPVHEVIIKGGVLSEEAWSCVVGAELLAMWGVNKLGEGRGWGWLLTTKLVDKYPKLFWETTRRELSALLSRWESLENYIDVRHEQALRWGRRLGFIFDGPTAYGVAGLPAQRFVVTKESFDVCTSSHTNRRRNGSRRSRRDLRG